MKFYKTYILIFITILLVSYLVLFKLNKINKAASPKVYNISDDEIVSVKVFQNESGENILLNKMGVKWFLKKYSESESSEMIEDALYRKFFPANEYYIKAILNSISNMISNKNISLTDDLNDEFGFKAPRVKVTFTTFNSDTHSFIIGNNAVFGGNLYIKDTSEIDGSDKNIYLVNNSIFKAFEKSFDDLRSSALVYFSSKDIDNVEIVSGKKKIVLKNSLIGWSITEPVIDRVNEFELNKFLLALTTADVMSFISDATEDKIIKKYGLDNPILTVMLKLKDSENKIFLKFSNYDSKILVMNMNEDFIAEVDSELYARLDISLSQLRDNKVISFYKWEVVKIEIEDQVQKTTSIKANNLWKTSQQLLETDRHELVQEIPLDGGIIESYLDLLHSMKVESIISGETDLKKYGLINPKIKVALYKASKGSDPVLIDIIYTGSLVRRSGKENNLYIKFESKPFVYLIGESFIKSIPSEYLVTYKPQVEKSQRRLIEKSGKIEKLDFPFVKNDISYVSIITTTKGTIEVELFSKQAPYTVSNFINLARNGFYDMLKFHRVAKDFLVQTGDPTGTGKGDPGYFFDDEISALKHLRGTISMAKTSKPNTNGSQFFICLSPQPHLDNNNTIFGKVTSGIEVVDSIVEGDKMLSVKTYEVIN